MAFKMHPRYLTGDFFDEKRDMQNQLTSTDWQTKRRITKREIVDAQSLRQFIVIDTIYDKIWPWWSTRDDQSSMNP